jgi:hypothetical protein
VVVPTAACAILVHRLVHHQSLADQSQTGFLTIKEVQLGQINGLEVLRGGINRHAVIIWILLLLLQGGMESMLQTRINPGMTGAIDSKGGLDLPQEGAMLRLLIKTLQLVITHHHLVIVWSIVKLYSREIFNVTLRGRGTTTAGNIQNGMRESSRAASVEGTMIDLWLLIAEGGVTIMVIPRNDLLPVPSQRIQYPEMFMSAVIHLRTIQIGVRGMWSIPTIVPHAWSHQETPLKTIQ